MRASDSTMAMAVEVMRSSLGAFFHNYHLFTSIAVLLAVPVSASVLVAEALVPSSTAVMQAISGRLLSMFAAAGFPSSAFFTLLHLKLSQTIFTFFFTLPFTLTFLLLAKAAIFAVFWEPLSRRRRLGRPRPSAVLQLYPSLLVTHIFNSLVILSGNAMVFSLLFLAFNAADLLAGGGMSTSSSAVLLLSGAGAVLYSVVIGVATVVSNLAMVTSAMESCAGHHAVLGACMLIKGRMSTALALALPTNMGMAAAEALFQLRVMRPYQESGRLATSALWEASSISYIHALCIVVEIIVSCFFFRECKLSAAAAAAGGGDEDPEEWRALEPHEKKGDLLA